MQSIESSIKRQLDVNKSKNLLFVNVKQIMDIEPSFPVALEELLDSTLRGKPESISSEIVSFATQAFLKNLYSVNQYLRISDQKVKELEKIYLQTWQIMIRTRNIQIVLREYHYPELSRWLATLYPKEFRKSLKLLPLVGSLVCEEYSDQFQIELLQIEVAHMKQPVIDIGCGSQANLVRKLRLLGIEAYGLDRYLEVQESYLTQIDWFEYPFEPAIWGTIISNMAFTNHLSYAHLYDASQLEQHLLKMRETIDSLAIGGHFYYAPSLPFIENWFVPERYKVEREQIMDELFVSTVTKIS
jgi:hypothetical protein